MDKPPGQLPGVGSTELRRLQPRPWGALSSPHTPPPPSPHGGPRTRPRPHRAHRPRSPPGGRRPLAGAFTWLLPPPLGPQQREVAVGPQTAQQQRQQGQEGSARHHQARHAGLRHGLPLPPRPSRAPLSRPRRCGSRPPLPEASACPTAAAPASSPPPASSSTPFPHTGRLRFVPRPGPALRRFPPRPGPVGGWRSRR